MVQKKNNPRLEELITRAKELTEKLVGDKTPDPDSILSPRQALSQREDNSHLSDYTDYLETFDVSKNKLKLPSDEFSKWSNIEKILSHLVYMGPISQKKAALVYDVWRLSAVIHDFNKTRTAPPFIGSVESPSRRGGDYSTYFLTGTKPEKQKKHRKAKRQRGE